jgi:hypothetical protein
MALTLRRDPDPITPASDDYLVEGEGETSRPTVGAQLVQVLQILLILFLAALTFGVFWLLGLLFNIF